MSDFVNYHKRGVTLPPGCKNLTDLFDPPAPPEEIMQAGFTPPLSVLSPKLPRFETIGNESGFVAVEAIETLLVRFYESPAHLCFLSLCIGGDETDDWSLMKMDWPSDKTLRSHLGIGRASAEHMDALKPVFAVHGVALSVTENFSIVKPEAPPKIEYTIEPLPPNAAACAKLLMELFRELVPRIHEAPLKYTYHEIRRKSDTA